jgi:GGDEF domain-containing protein
MEPRELIIWSAMLGGLLTLATVAVADVAMHRSVAAWRGLAFLLTTGFSALLLTGLAEYFFPALAGRPLLVLKTSLAPLSGALALTYLGLWMGVAAEDTVVRVTTIWGSGGLLTGAAAMAALSLISPEENATNLLTITAVLNGLAVVFGAIASMRAVVLGDQLARWMVVACLFLAITVAGLHSHNLMMPNPGTAALLTIAFSTVAFFLVVTALGIRRSRMIRQLTRLAGLSLGADPATGLPRGSVLLSKVDDAFWRSSRMHRECTVVCLHVRNLYELGEIAGHQVDQQILVALAARIRRAVGFRNVVGLYHPRCFVVVISAVKQPRMLQSTVLRLRYAMSKPLTVVGDGEGNHSFIPRFGIGTITVNATEADPATVIDQAERMAFAADSGPDEEPDPTSPAFLV